jgi:hypothetical protein
MDSFGTRAKVLLPVKGFLEQLTTTIAVIIDIESIVLIVFITSVV